MTNSKTDLVKETLDRNENQSSLKEQLVIKKKNDDTIPKRRWLEISHQRDVLQGIIWAEIIGQPKSRRPKLCRLQRFQ